MALLERCKTSAWPRKCELRTFLSTFDTVWANFEESYITELEHVQTQARQIVNNCIKHERNLACMQEEESYGCWQAAKEEGSKVHCVNVDMRSNERYRQEMDRFVQCICKLNSVANSKGKGRADLGVNILWDAIAVLFNSPDQQQGGESLAVNVGRSFQRIRCVSQCVERIDPHLANNEGLVRHLVDWEESWEVAGKYMVNSQMLAAICNVAVVFRQEDPGLAKMMEECDAEFCLGLPRLVWLQFLKCQRMHLGLLQHFLPHRFPGEGEMDNHSDPAMGAIECIPDAELNDLTERYDFACRELVNRLRSKTQRCDIGDFGTVEQLLARQAFIGLNCEALGGHEVELTPELRQAAQAIVSDLMHALEKWSIELQRHCPERWNQYMAVV